MKKYMTFFLGMIMLLSLFSCKNNKINDKENHHTTSEIPSENAAQEDYSTILNMYRSIIEILPNYVDSKEAMDDACTDLGIDSKEEKELFEKIFWSAFDFQKAPLYKLSYGYAIKDLNGDGVDELVLLHQDYMIIAVFSFADQKPVLLGNYLSRGSCWIDGHGWLHENGSSGADHSTNAVYRISDGGSELELIVEFGTNGHEWIGDMAHTNYYQLVNGEKAEITETEYQDLNEQYGQYLGSQAGAAATKEHAGLVFLSMYTEAEIAMEAYEAALENEIKVYETDIEKYHDLKDCKTPYNRIPLCEFENMGYVYMDVDGDSINELVIDCGDTLILRYYEGCVYIYPFTFRNMHQLNTDGSYSWNHNGQNFEYGESKLAFDGAELKTQELWRIVNDGEPNAEYYMDGKPVTQKEIRKYCKDNPKTKVDFVTLEVSWESHDDPDDKG